MSINDPEKEIKVTNCSFSEAFRHVKQGKAMRLPSWGEDVKVRVQYPDNGSKMTHPYLYVESRYGRVPWKETYVEMFSNEWVVTD